MSPSEWTIDTLREHFEARMEAQREHFLSLISAQEKAVQAALVAAKEAVLKAETASEKRFNEQNEFRGQLKDQASTFVARTEVDAKLSALSDKLEVFEKRTITSIAASGGRVAGIGAGWGILLGAIGLIASVVSIVTVMRQ